MASHNAYAAYKRDNKYLLHWMINTSIGIIRRLAAGETSSCIPLSVNSTGETTVAELVVMSEIIANHISPVPTLIYRLLNSVIKARVAAYTFFVKAAAETQDPNLEEQNASHKHFIDALEEMLQNLGGQSRSDAEAPSDENEDAAIEQVIFFNKFAALQLDGLDDGEDQSDDPEAQQKKGQRQPRPRKSKGKKKNRSKTKRQQRASKTEDPLESLTLESYRIIKDNEYLVAVFELSRFSPIGVLLPYDGEHIAVAGAVSDTAIAMTKRTSSELYVEFPGHDSFETVTRTITRGRNFDTLCDFPVALHTAEGGQAATKTQARAQDI